MAKNKKKTVAKKATREAKKAAKKNPKLFIAIVAFILVIAIVVGACWYFFIYKKQDPAENPANPDNTHQSDSNGDSQNGGTQGDGTQNGDTQGGTQNGDTQGGTQGGGTQGGGTEASDLSIHFLELGVANAGDCVLIKSGDTEVLIDAGAKSNTAPTKAMRDYVAQYCTDGTLEYVIATHAHEDHIAGLVGDKNNSARPGFLYQYKIGTIIQFARTGSSSNIYKNYQTAVEYCREQGTNVYTALECTQETNGASATYYLDEAQTISMTILYQKYYEQKASTENDYSVCMLLTQKTAEKEYNALFTGDLEESGERSLVENNPNLPHCDLFKGGHHGSSTSSNEVLLDKITPDNIAICTCAGTFEYAKKPSAGGSILNTFPTQEAINRMAKHTKNIYVTTLGIISSADYSTTGFKSMNGNIVFYYDKDEKTMKLRCSNNTTILKDTEWFKANRTWPDYGVQ